MLLVASHVINSFIMMNHSDLFHSILSSIPVYVLTTKELIRFSMLFIQSRTNETTGTSKDLSSSKSSAIPDLSKTTNFDRSTSMHTLPSPTKKKSLPKRSITFADLPPSLKKSADCIAYLSRDKLSATPATEQPIRSSQETLDSHPRVTSSQMHARFQLPPTPLTNPERWENLDTSTPLRKQQIARSVGGNVGEVGFRSICNYVHTNI